jgi:site-specific recombinase XerD
MCSFLAVLGLRASELIEADINWISRERLIDNDDQATWMMQVLGKGRRIRRLPLSPELVEVNEIWQKEREERFGKARPDDPLFVTKAYSEDLEGKRFTYQNLRYWLRILNRIAGLRDRSPHSLRHTAGVQLASDGVPINAIQSLLGHANISTTSIYTELAGGELVGVVRKSASNTLLGDTLKGN